MNALAEVKAVARKAGFAARKAAHAAGQGAACDHLATALASHAGVAVAAYMPMRTEIDPLPALSRHGGPVLMPVVTAPGECLRFRAWTPDSPMADGGFGTRIPATGDWVEPRVLIVPLLAFDRRGFRLGYGGGFYDRTLQALRASGPVTAIGFAFAAQELPTVPIDATDQPLDLIVTEAGPILPLSAGANALGG
jgi:5-formyltetrahydrofolate cyclo-ligase